MSVLDEQEESADVMMMRMALHVAHRGRPSPNPHVGAVLTRDGELVATGYHRAAGQAHAEVDALAKLQGDARGTTLYVTLEPCDHQGRTGPCSQVLIDAGVSRVVIGCLDPVPAHGGGAARLREAGVEVEVGVCGPEAEALIADFSKHTLRGLPFVTLKAAVTLDGRMASRTGDSRWITCEASRREAHRLRDRHDAVLVGVGTVLADDPALNVRHVRGKDPIRVVLDSQLRTPPLSRMLQQSSDAPTWILHGPGVDETRAGALRAVGATLIELPDGGPRMTEEALRMLASRDVVRVLVEGGPAVHGALLDGGLADRACVFVAPRLLGDPAGMPLASGAPRQNMMEAMRLEDVQIRRFGDDVCFDGRIRAPGEPPGDSSAGDSTPDGLALPTGD